MTLSADVSSNEIINEIKIWNCRQKKNIFLTIQAHFGFHFGGKDYIMGWIGQFQGFTLSIIKSVNTK